ncbi:MAG: 4-hydroxybenzoate octaprenyltransferase [Gammaproteobacteria bacterium]|nr:4-hydroxybenzoate octaprenyltransferase [Gammaproteobacteria bacterium]
MTRPQKLKALIELMRLDRPVGTLLLLWPTLTALWLAAEAAPTLWILCTFIAGTFVMRAAGCVANDIVDRHVDPFVERTKSRPLADGRLRLFEAIILFAALSSLALALMLMLNAMTRWMAVAGFCIAIVYPFMKRITFFPQVVLGIAFSWGIPMASTAVREGLSIPICLFFLMSVIWIIAYDTEYAMVDRKDDRTIDVKSTALLLGNWDRLAIGLMQFVSLVLLFLLGKICGFQTPYSLAVIIVAGLFIYQQILIRTRDETRCFKAFGNNTWVGFTIFIGVVAEHLIGIPAT